MLISEERNVSTQSRLLINRLKLQVTSPESLSRMSCSLRGENRLDGHRNWTSNPKEKGVVAYGKVAAPVDQTPEMAKKNPVWSLT